MSRKRFIKLMMARGYSRNTSAALATQVSRYGSYEEMYQALTTVSPLAETLQEAFQLLTRGLLSGLADLFNAMSGACAGIAENMRRMADG